MALWIELLGKRPLLISPHCDDLILSLGGIMTDITTGHRVSVCNVFNRSIFTKWGIGSLGRVSRRRYLEDIKAFESLSLRRYDLNLVDWHSTKMLGLEPVTEQDVVRLLVNLCKYIKPTALVGPMGIGKHADHLLARYASLKVKKQFGIPLISYIDLPYAISNKLPRGIEVVRGNLEEKKIRLKAYRSQLSDNDIDKVIEYGFLAGGEEVICE